jgi:hypothetical protein
MIDLETALRCLASAAISSFLQTLRFCVKMHLCEGLPPNVENQKRPLSGLKKIIFS